MDRKQLFSKGLVVAVIILFLGLVIAPSINVACKIFCFGRIENIVFK